MICVNVTNTLNKDRQTQTNRQTDSQMERRTRE